MSDRHKSRPKAVRMPDGLLPRIRDALGDGESVNAFIVAAVGERLARRGGGSTAGSGGATTGAAMPCGATAGGATTGEAAIEPARAEPGAAPAGGRKAGRCPHRLPSGAWCKSCGTAKA